ncbi:MAG: peptide-methionine (R)-S-oxide reductase MsrB [Pseudomonadales bacterium]|jgi:peptide-methionine (R)-S-oxide reductase|nr:peptide-methionine (R)-S-oxide reductase MsrB [Pseudomonadales bacterium]
MRRRTLLAGLTGSLTLPLLGACARPVSAEAPVPLAKSAEEWKALLEANRYRILFEEGTERAYTSPLNDEKRAGTYICAACFLPLFSSEAKYDSGTGWPSFFQALPDAMGTKKDYKLFLPRTEYHCARCGGHQGHVFDDGPRPTGKRWCNNGLALLFVPEGDALPELRS